MTATDISGVLFKAWLGSSPRCAATCRAVTALAPGASRPTGSWPRLALWYNPIHTRTVKTAISVPDDVFKQAERYAKKLGVSRSELYTRAVRQLIETERDREILASYDQAFGSDAGDDDTRWLRRSAAREALVEVEWE